MGKVLLLGSGFVAKPTVDYLARKSDNHITVAARRVEHAAKLAEGVKNASAISLDVSDSVALDAQMAKHDLVVSLIPYTHHVKVIESAIRNKVNVVTTSYVSPAMRELDEKCKQAGIVVMNEIGLDPGIDHLYAVKTIDEVHRNGGKIISFLSYCGGLPAPEDSDNPLGYKFSWSSRGVLLALRNSARFYRNGELVEIDGKDLMGSAKPYYIYPGFAFLAYPNRDSTPYREYYNIPEAETVIRGTLRYQGFPEFVRTLVALGMLDDTEKPFLTKSIPWKDALAELLNSKSSSEQDLTMLISSKATFDDEDQKSRILDGLRWLGLFSDQPIIPRGNPLDTLCATLEEKCQYEPGERDMVMLQHKFIIQNSDGSRETRTSTLLDYGNPSGYSSMARLVGIPCGVACQQVLDGIINTPGVLAPLNRQLNDPLISDLKKEGIFCVEKTL